MGPVAKSRRDRKMDGMLTVSIGISVGIDNGPGDCHYIRNPYLCPIKIELI